MGGPRREFFRILSIHAKDVFFIGLPHCKFFSSDASAIQVFTPIETMNGLPMLRVDTVLTQKL